MSEEVSVFSEQTTDWSEMDVADLVGTELEWSTITCSTRSARTKQKVCLFCAKSYTGGPIHIREHLDPNVKPRHVTFALQASC